MTIQSNKKLSTKSSNQQTTIGTTQESIAPTTKPTVRENKKDATHREYIRRTNQQILISDQISIHHGFSNSFTTSFFLFICILTSILYIIFLHRTALLFHANHILHFTNITSSSIKQKAPNNHKTPAVHKLPTLITTLPPSLLTATLF